VSRPTQTAITLLLPFQRYRLRFSHRLLDSLGGVSRFILRALADGLTLERIAEVVALSHTVLLQQMAFLAQHHFLAMARDDGDAAPVVTLLERGGRMVAVERRLREGDHLVWLDAFTLDRKAVHMLVTTDPESLVRIPSGETNLDGKAVVRLPSRGHPYHLFDDASRLHRLLSQDKLATLLGHFWRDAESLIAEEIDNMDYILSTEPTNEPEYHPVIIEPAELFDISDGSVPEKRPTLPPLLVPVLGMKVEFSRVEGFPWPVVVPPARTSYMELVTHRSLPHFVADGVTEPPAHGVAVAPAAIGANLPEIDETVVPPGLSATFSAIRTFARRDIDHLALTIRMHERADAMLISFNQPTSEAEPSCA